MTTPTASLPLSAAVEASGVSPSAIHDAHDRIRPYIHQTPLLHSTQLDTLLTDGKATIHFKCESFQRTGSFKIRGALNALSLLQTPHPVVTHSSGNHAQAIACAAKQFNRKAVVVIPNDAPSVKVDAVRGYGAEIVRCQNTLEDRERTADQIVQEQGAVLVHPYLNVNVVAGQGTVGLEILEQMPDVSTVVVPIGGGGLISGITMAVKSKLPHVRIIGAEPRNVSAGAQSLQQGKRVVFTGQTIADGLKASLGHVAWQIVSRLVDDVIVVDEDDILECMSWIWSRLKVVIEPSAAVGVAAVRKSRLKGNVVIVLCGGNLDVARVLPLMQRQEM